MSCALSLFSLQVHFILRHQNPVTGKWEEKHAKNPPAIKGDQKTHLYTLVIRPDNSFEIFIDKESAKKGRYGFALSTRAFFKSQDTFKF